MSCHTISAVHDARRRRGWTVAEARVVVVVVDVEDVHRLRGGGDRVAVDVPAVQEDDRALVEVARQLGDQAVERRNAYS